MSMTNSDAQLDIQAALQDLIALMKTFTYAGEATKSGAGYSWARGVKVFPKMFGWRR